MNNRRMSEVSSQNSHVTDAKFAWIRSRPLKLVWTVLEPLSVAGLFVFILAKSWLRWGDPVVDFPRDLYIAWRLSEGDLLYQKIANWYGPLANLVEGAGFKIFGVGLDTMVWMNIVLTVIILLLLRGIFNTIGNRLMVWLASVSFICIFMAGHYSEASVFNFITPYVAQVTYSFLGLLLALWGLLKHLKADRSIWLGVAGLGLAVAYLDKQEALLAAAGASGIYFLMRTIQMTRQNGRSAGWRWLLKSLAWVIGGFVGLWLPVFGYFFTKGGFVFAMKATNYVVVFPLTGKVRHVVATAPLFRTLIGFDGPLYNFLIQLKMGGVLVIICAMIIASGLAWSCARRLSPAWWLCLLVIIGVSLAGSWLALITNGDFVRAFAFPVVLGAAGYSVVSLWMAWWDRAEFSRTLGLAVVGVAAMAMFMRMFLHLTLNAYGFYMVPLSLFFWFQLMVVEAPRAMVLRGRPCWPVATAFTVILLFLGGYLMVTSLEVYARKTYPVGEGRDRSYTARPEAYVFGLEVNVMTEMYRKLTPDAKTLVAFPEGISVNYLLRVPTSLAELEFGEVPFGYVGPQHVLDELKAHPPDAVYLFTVDLSGDNVPYFGADEASGRNIVLWLNDNYSIAFRYAKSEQTITGDGIDLLLPKVANDNRLPLLPKEK